MRPWRNSGPGIARPPGRSLNRAPRRQRCEQQSSSARPLRRGLRLCLATAGAAACLTASASAALPAPPDGTLATSFGDGGRATLPIPGVSTMFTRGEAIQRDGKIVVAGYGLRSCGLTCSGDNNVIVVARYDPATNRLDPTFGDGGVVVTDFTAGSDADVSREEAHALALTSDGKIVVAGSALRGALSRQLLLARYTPDGDLDPHVRRRRQGPHAGAGANVAEFNALSLEADGSIVAAGNVAVAPNPAGGEPGFSNIALARYRPDGSLDAGFGDGGIVARASLPGIGQALTRRGTSILVTGSRFAARTAAQRSEYVLARFNADGTVDRSFGDQGSIGADFSTSTRSASSLATGIGVLLDGRIVVSGEVEQTPALAAGPDVPLRRRRPLHRRRSSGRHAERGRRRRRPSAGRSRRRARRPCERAAP